METKIEIVLSPFNGEEQTLINGTLNIEGEESSEVMNRLGGFIGAVLKSEAVMNVFGLDPIHREKGVVPSLIPRNGFSIDSVLNKKNGLQKKIQRRPDSKDELESFQLHIQVTIE